MTRNHLIRLSGIAALAAVATSPIACSQNPIDDTDLVASLESFQLAVDGQPRDIIKTLVREQATEFKDRQLRVSSAVVASTYVRDNTSNIYFGVTYDPQDHLYLRDIDPALHAMLAHHRLWVSIVKTYPSRQISYELPVDRPIFESLVSGQEVDFSCTIAALIRGKSVYCRPDQTKIAIAR
jgi:hypothetical protein